MNVLVTGGAGFIGSHLCKRLLAENHHVHVIDNFDPFYDEQIKRQNMEELSASFGEKLVLIEGDICESTTYGMLPGQFFDLIIHLAGKAGVRPSIREAAAYERVNVKGTLALLEYAKENQVNNFIYASSSSVYGVNPVFPWSENTTELMPISPYAATKLAGEHLGFTYAYLYGIQFTALRFFTVYGPGQRPDLAIHKFFRNLYNNIPIDMYGDGSTKRDYTYIDDIISGVINAISLKPEKRFNVFNLGNNRPYTLKELLDGIEKITKKQFVVNQKEMQPGDVPITFADISKAQKELHYHPATDLNTGLIHFRDWFENHYQ